MTDPQKILDMAAALREASPGDLMIAGVKGFIYRKGKNGAWYQHKRPYMITTGYGKSYRSDRKSSIGLARIAALAPWVIM